MKNIFRKFLYLILASVMAVCMGGFANAQPVYVLAQLKRGTSTRGLVQDTPVRLSLGGAVVSAKIVSICGSVVEFVYDDNGSPERLPIFLRESDFTKLETGSTYFCKLWCVSILDLLKKNDIGLYGDGLDPNYLLKEADL